MKYCQWYVQENAVCGNPATTLMSRHPTEEEQVFEQDDRGVSFVGIVECAVCDDHLADARQQYSYESAMLNT